MQRLKRAVRALAGRGAGGKKHQHPTYTEAELLRRAEEFNRNAELHWQGIDADSAGRAHVLNKPISTVSDTPDILYRLGLLLAELRVGVGHTVLDLGAGSCWLSSYLNRLRCRTISIDVSPTALKLGRELFSLDARHRMDLEPRFIDYDGHRIPLDDASVDRAVCFDAFHHVPNQDEVLSELFRVLKPGGRAVFAEPGEDHSHMDQSLYETERCGVLENDLDLSELIPRAKRLGFSEVLVKPYPDATLSFDSAKYTKFMAGSDSLFPIDQLREGLRHFAVFVLLKGTEDYDSRSPNKLQAKITLPDPMPAVSGAAGSLVELKVRVQNTGDTTWLCAKDDLGGYVTLGGHLYGADKQPMTRSIFRTFFDAPVKPGDSSDVVAAIPMPFEPGRYYVKLDLADEWVAWFEQYGSETPGFPIDVVEGHADSRRPRKLGAELSSVGEPVRAFSGGRARVRVSARNSGDTLWLHSTGEAAGSVQLAGILRGPDGLVIGSESRSVLAAPVAPGDAVELTHEVPAPDTPGTYTLELGLLAEGVARFSDLGSAPVTVPIEVRPAVALDSADPGSLLARIEILDGAQAHPVLSGGDVRLPVRITNVGNTTWLHAARAAGGHVTLGGRLRDGHRALLQPDFFRQPLAGDVPPGGSIDVEARFAAPAAPGRYVVELDMVDEGIAWFGDRGSARVDIELVVTKG